MGITFFAIPVLGASGVVRYFVRLLIMEDLEGDKAQEVLNLIENDEDIAALVLAAAASKEGPGPLVSSLAKNAGDFPIPVAIVPATSATKNSTRCPDARCAQSVRIAFDPTGAFRLGNCC